MDQEGQRAIKLIEVNSSGKYVLSEEGKAFISKIKGPIAVISVAGMYRTGKSYLLNRMLLNRSNGFGVGPTVNPCTKGLWCWGKTVMGKTADGESINVIIIDTQGIGALDEDQTHDTRIFTLAILSASSFIYNSTGSIDQNALQNLSLVVNLTKNIQLSTTQSQQEEDDPEELAQYFPAFYWIVRDFSLQLINSQGDQITPKQYLQRALAPQKGFSDDIEEKNRIRRLLSSFFKERECFTLVRPLVDQKKLQHLDQLDLDQLRPEFVDQVMNFRRRILGRVKPKMFKGKQLDGPMYLCLLSSYVNAINNGAVPNIQNAWNYMCQQKCAKAFQDSIAYFQEQAEKSIKCVMPVEQEYLLAQLKSIKQKACDFFEMNSVGDRMKFHLKELRQSLELKIQSLKAQNEQHSQITLKNFFRKSIMQIQNKLRLKQYESYEQFMKELNLFYNSLFENAPALPKKDIVFLTLLRKVIPTAAQIFLKDKSDQLKFLKATTDQKQVNFQTVIEQLKKQIKSIEENNKQKLTKLDREKISLQFQLEDLKKTLQQIKQKNVLQCQKLQLQIKQNGEVNKRKEQSLNEKILVLNQQINKLQSQLMTTKCENQKQSALINLKNRQLINQIQQIKKKQTLSLLNFKNLEVTNNNTVKNLKQQYEERLKQKQLQLRKLRLASTDFQQHNKLLEQELNQFKVQADTQIQQLKILVNRKQAQLNKVSRQKQQQQSQYKKLTGEEVEKLNSDLNKYIQKSNELQKNLKTQLEIFTNKQRSYNTQLILIKQKVQFAEMEAKQYKNQLVKTKIQYQDKINALIQENSSKEDQYLKLQELSDTYQNKITQLKSEYEQNNKKMSSQIQQLSRQLAEVQIQAKSTKNKLQAQLDEKENVIKDLQQSMEFQEGDLEQKVANLQLEWKIKEKMYQQKIQKLQNALEESKDQMLRQQREGHEKSEEIVLQLKNYYQIQKQKLESKIIAQKQKYDRKITQLKFEHQQKLREQTMQLEAQFQFMKQKFAQLEEQLMKQKTNRKIEADIKNKTIQNLQRANQDIKSKIDNKEVELLNKIDRIQKERNVQKEALYAKIEELHTKQSKMQKQRAGLSHAKDQLQKIMQIKDKTLQELKQELASFKQKNQNDKQSQKLLRNELNTKLMEDKVEFEKKMALLTQENEYLKIKIQQNEKYLTSHNTSQEDKLKKTKEQFMEQLKNIKQKSLIQMEGLESKYDKLKKSAKEKQATMQKSINYLEKQLAISNQKIINLSDKLKAHQQKQHNESEQYSQNISNLKGNLIKEKQLLKEQLQLEIREKQKLQSQKVSLTAAYQQEKMLLENKNKFLEEGKERYRVEYEQTKSRLETIIQNNRKKWAQQKSNLELAHSDHVAKIEKKYWQEKQQLSENYKKQEIDYENKLKTSQAQIRILSQKLAIEEQNKMGSQNVSDRRFKQMSNNQKKLQSELDRLKAIRQSQQIDLQNQQKEKEVLKQKLNQKQQKYKTLEKSKQHLFYEFEKQRAKWKLEKENVITKTQQQKQQISKIEKEIEKLQRENQKLKVERKCQKTSMQSMTRFSNNFSMDKGLSRSSLQQSVLKQNSNNTSQISDTSLFFKE